MLLPYRDGHLPPPISISRHDLSLFNKEITFATLPALQTQPLTDTVFGMFSLFKKRPNRPFTSRDILSALDKSAADFQFPMLDNGYIYLAASRLSLYGSTDCWAIVIETFGFSPRVGEPDLTITTISNRLHNRNSVSDYVSLDAYQSYLSNKPNTDMRQFWPIPNASWIDQDDPEHVVLNGILHLRERKMGIPERADIEAAGIELESDRIAIFEVCRFLAEKHRADVLGTEIERRVSVDPQMREILMLDDWHHPDLAASQMPSQTRTFKNFAQILEDGNLDRFRVSEVPNNHWKNWPDGGTL